MITINIPCDGEVVGQLCDVLGMFLLREKLRSKDGALESLLEIAECLPLGSPVSAFDMKLFESEYQRLESMKRAITLKYEEIPNDKNRNTI